jgi:hypothetical protein
MTYAQRAKVIMKKYERFKGDPISERSMDMELEQLASEQEEEKTAKGIPSEGQEMAYGGYKKMAYGGGIGGGMTTDLNNGLLIPELFGSNGIAASGSPNPVSGVGQDFTGAPLNRNPQFANGLPVAEVQGQRIIPQAPNTGTQETPQHIKDKANKIFGSKGMLDPSVNVGAGLMGDPKQTQTSPFGQAGGYGSTVPQGGKSSSAIGEDGGGAGKVGWKGMAGVAGNAYDLTDALINGPEEVNYDRLDPALMSGENQKREARRSANTAYNNMAEQGRETSQNSGQRLGRTSALESTRGQRISEALNSIDERVETANTGIKNRAEEYNTGLSNQETQENMQAQMAHRLRIANNLNQIGGGFAAQGAEQNQADVDFAKNDRLIRAINNGVLTDFNMNELLEILGN